jgi:hypothetical protein
VIIYPYLRTQRIAVKLRELTTGESIDLLKLPGERHELCTTELLRRIAGSAEAPRPGYITDPRLWTVEERAFLVCNYLTMVTDDGPDFSLGQGHLSDYIEFTADLPVKFVPLGEVLGKQTVMRPLLGAHAEVMELECTSHGEWIMAAMACQLSDAAEPEPDWSELAGATMLEWMRAKMDKLKAMPESEFEALFAVFMAGQRQLYHFLSPVFGDDGILWANQSEEGAGTNPARFQPLSCISPATRSLFGRAAGPAA